MAKLDWMLVVDLFETETASFWKRPGVDPSEIQTEVFLLPAVCSFEKEGSLTNSGRWCQWRYKAVDGPGDAKPDLWIITQIVQHLQALYEAEGGPNSEAITQLTWDYGEDPDPERVAMEINGYALEDVTDADGNVVVAAGHQVPSFTKLTDDGKTASGNWLYCGHFTDEGNMSKRRDLTDPSGIGLYPNWAWSWPVNRRIIYNRASVDMLGQPWDEEHPVIRWEDDKWVGDVPDGGWPPMMVNPEKTKLPFIMKPDGVASIFGPGLRDGPLPEHYEPWESPEANRLSSTQNNPNLQSWGEPIKGDPEQYPLIGTTYRLTEHWLSGAMTRNLPWLVEAFPEMFVEINPQLAEERSIQHGDMIVVESARGSITARVSVTPRIQSFRSNGKTVHLVGIPWHWGYMGRSTGDSANLLTPPVGDANTGIPEYKAFLCDIRLA
jgi:anaerobic selenocysteine-containing dehydrogenase